MKPTKENFFKVSDGAFIYYEDYGKENKGDPIVLVHGYLCSTKFFQKNIEALSANNRLILVDLRGHGYSSKAPWNLTMARCAQDIKELLDALNIENAVLIGWSMGGSVVMAYYDQFGSAHLKVIGTLDSCIYPFSDADCNPHAVRDYNMEKVCNTLEYVIYHHHEYCRGFAKAAFGTAPSKEDEDWVTAEMMKIPAWIAFALYCDFVVSDYSVVLDKITIPFFGAGVNSNLIPIGADAAKYYTTRVAGPSYFHEFYGGHMTFYEDPESFNEVLLDFVNNFAK